VLRRRIDELFTAWPFLGSRRMTTLLRAEGHAVNRKRIRRLMREMGIAALGPKPRLSKPSPGHKIYPYLLRGLAIDRPNQVWCADITYIPIGRGFLYLVAIMEWAARSASRRWTRPWRASAGRTSSTPTRAASSPAPPSPASWQPPAYASRWTAAAAGWTTYSSSGCGAHSSYEDIYLKGYADGREAKAGIASWITFYNG
jgi:putative transposase